jgi:hypothetical protein
MGGFFTEAGSWVCGFDLFDVLCTQLAAAQLLKQLVGSEACSPLHSHGLLDLVALSC